ncbi:MAG TPA: FAD-binding protein, partial [Dehalococcoidales bacterium]|nr:FAD-binding protein [Dehalococcoidales bacterium]
VTHLPPSKVTTRFPHIYSFCLEQGLDITQDLIPVAPAAHYMIGGVKTNIWGETSIAGLFACGETACSGIHGANRLASNSLLEAVVFGKRIIKRTGDGVKTAPAPERQGALRQSLGSKRVPKAATSPSLSALQQLHWDKVGIIRNREGLAEAANTLAAWQRALPQPADRPSYELSNLIFTGRLMTEAALLREESRGAHFRTDFAATLPEWQRHIIFSRN